MKRSRITPRRLLLIITLALLVLCFLPVSVLGTLASRPRMALVALLNPVSGGLKTVGDHLRPGKQLHAAWEDRADLNKDYALALAVIQRQAAENRELRRRLKQFALLRQKFGLEGMRFVDCRVTAYSGDGPVPTITLDRGSEQGVRNGLVVASGANLVGRVVRVGPLSCDVRVVTGLTPIHVVILPPTLQTKAPGLGVWLKSSAVDGAAMGVRAEHHAKVAVGDLAFLADDGWPHEAQRLIVGQVTQVKPDAREPLLLKDVVVQPRRDVRAIVQPREDLATLSHVTVLVPR